jgi:regulator of replication initiation timing
MEVRRPLKKDRGLLAASFKRPLIFALGTIAWGCATHVPPEPLQPRSSDRTIYVSDRDLPGQCYHELGTLKFDEPFTDSVIDPEGTQMAKRLQSMALGKYPNDVDAVIDVKSEQNSIGSVVTISGKAIELVEHETVECAVRQIPGVVNATAAIATGAAVGGMVGSFTNGQPSTAMSGAAIGASIAGTKPATDADQLQQAQINRQLQEQREEIARLQAERSQLRQCLEQEVPASSCETEKAQVGQWPAAPVSGDSNNWEASSFELQRQIQEQQTYINQLRQQISDIRQQMNSSR